VRTRPVFASVGSELSTAIEAAGGSVTVTGPDTAANAAVLLAAVAKQDTVVWLAGPSGDDSLARELGLALARAPGTADLELMYGSWDPIGARLLDVVTVMDRLVSPGGDPWKREQTHQTLARYLLEEAYEAYDAIDEHNLDALREELGDVLLQVVLHARMAEEASPPWSIDDLAGNLVEKLVRRNPHVFGDVQVADVDEIIANWERIKKSEKERDSILDGIAWGQPALALAGKILARAARAGIAVPGSDRIAGLPVADEAELGELLFALVADAQGRGLDAEAALRRASLSRADAIRLAEGSPVLEGRTADERAGRAPARPARGRLERDTADERAGRAPARPARGRLERDTGGAEHDRDGPVADAGADGPIG
jgi:XTP/dITP diphosphohydrolase